MAAFHTVPLAVVYGAWYRPTGPTTTTVFGQPTLRRHHRLGARGADGSVRRTRPLRRGRRSARGGAGRGGRAGLVAPAAGRAPAPGRGAPGPRAGRTAVLGHRRAAVVGGRACTSLGRAGTCTSSPRAVLPLLAVGADGLARRWRWLTPVMVGLLLLGVPFNVGQLAPSAPFDATYFAHQRWVLMAAPSSPVAKEVPSDVMPIPGDFLPFGLDIGYLNRAKKDGKLPDPPELRQGSAERAARQAGRVSFQGAGRPGRVQRPDQTVWSSTRPKGDTFQIVDPCASPRGRAIRPPRSRSPMHRRTVMSSPSRSTACICWCSRGAASPPSSSATP